MSVVKYILSSSLSRNAAYVLTIATGLVVTPILVRTLGSTEYAKWILVNTLLIYFMIFDFGYSTSVARFVSRKYKAWGENSTEKCITTAFYILCGAMVIALLLILSGYSYIRAKYMAGMSDDVVTAVMFLIFACGSMIPLRVFHGVLRAQLKWNTISLIVMIKSVLMNLVIIYMVLNGYGLFGIIIPNALFIFLEYFAYYVFARRAIIFSLHPRSFEYRILKELTSYSFSLFLHAVSIMFGRRMQTYFIALYISLPAVTVYTIGLQLLKYFDDLMRSSFDIMTPYFSKHEDDPKRMINDYITISSYCFAVAAFGGFMIAVYCQSFLYFWVGPELVESSMVVYALVIPYVLFASHIPSRNLVIGTSNQNFMVVLSIIEFAINLTALFFVVPRYGMAGILWTMGSTMLFFRAIIFPVMMFRKMQVPVMRYLYTVYAKPLVIFMIPQTLVYFFIFTRFDKFSLEIGWVFTLNILLFCATFLVMVRKALHPPREQVKQEV